MFCTQASLKPRRNGEGRFPVYVLERCCDCVLGSWGTSSSWSTPWGRFLHATIRDELFYFVCACVFSLYDIASMKNEELSWLCSACDNSGGLSDRSTWQNVGYRRFRIETNSYSRAASFLFVFFCLGAFCREQK